MSKYLFLTFFCVLFQGLFAFFEMACVSLNKVRLQYYVSIGSKRAFWLENLLKKPTRLFGTTLIGITSSLVIGSESSRRLYESIGLNPDWAPITQFPLVLIFAELVPMFAARRHAESAAFALAPIMIVISKLFLPLTALFELLSKVVYVLLGSSKQTQNAALSREELKMIFEEGEEGKDEFQSAVSQIFQLKNMTADQLMIPLNEVQMAPSYSTVLDLKHLLSVNYASIVPIYHKDPHNIVSIVILRDLMSLDENKKVLDAGKSPWFLTADTSILNLIQEFRRNNQSVAVILDQLGKAIGILTLDQILDSIFGEEMQKVSKNSLLKIERTLSGNMLICQFNKQFEAQLNANDEATLEDFLLAHFDHAPIKGEVIILDDFEFSIDELTLRGGIKTLHVRSLEK